MSNSHVLDTRQAPPQGNTRTQQPSSRSTTPATRQNHPTPPPSHPNPRGEQISLSAETSWPERSNGHAAIAGLAASLGGASAEGLHAVGSPLQESHANHNSQQAPVGYRATNLPIGQDGHDAHGWHLQHVPGHPEEDPIILQRDVNELNVIGEQFRNSRHDNLEISSGERDSLHTARTFLGQLPSHQQELYGSQPNFHEYQDQLRSIPGWTPPRQGESERDYAQRLSPLLPEFNNRVANLMRQRDPHYLSNHQDGNSFDISLRGSHMGFTDIAEARRLFEARGYRVTEETDHLHVDRPGPHSVTTDAHPTIQPIDWLYRFQNELADQARDNPYASMNSAGLN